jgi:hypothetical protein
MKGLGACTVAIANQLTPDVRSSADLATELDLPGPELARLIVYVVWGQLPGHRMGLRKGLDPDFPRHLSRVVTLEGEPRSGGAKWPIPPSVNLNRDQEVALSPVAGHRTACFYVRKLASDQANQA